MTIPRLIAHGAFADVFDLGDATVAKIFRRTKHTNDAVRDWADHDFLTSCLFAIEVDAYERLQRRPDLSAYLPRYYGRLDDPSVFLQNSSTGQPFVSACALRLELIPGRDIKAGLVNETLRDDVDQVLWEISDFVGRVNVWDCSCFVPGSRTPFTIIDFAMWDDLSDAQHYFDRHGRLPDALRKRRSVV
jgi:hypothetical protein